MPKPLVVAILLHPILLFGASLQAQDRSDGQWELMLLGGPSAFRLDLFTETSWRTAVNGRLRLVLGNHLHFETGMTAPLSTRANSLNCPDQLNADCVSQYGEKKFSVLSAAIGFQTRINRFTPYLGIGRGRLSADDEVQSSWLFYSGSEIHLSPSLGLILDYRIHRVEWDYEGTGRNQEMSLGFSVDLLSRPVR